LQKLQWHRYLSAGTMTMTVLQDRITTTFQATIATIRP
jgi:hypothetical protein